MKFMILTYFIKIRMKYFYLKILKKLIQKNVLTVIFVIGQNNVITNGLKREI